MQVMPVGPGDGALCAPVAKGTNYDVATLSHWRLAATAGRAGFRSAHAQDCHRRTFGERCGRVKVIRNENRDRLYFPHA